MLPAVAIDVVERKSSDDATLLRRIFMIDVVYIEKYDDEDEACTKCDAVFL